MKSEIIDFLQENTIRYKKLIKGEKVSHAPFRLWLDDTFVRYFADVDKQAYQNSFETMFEAQKLVHDRYYGLREFAVEVDCMDIYFDREKFISENPDKPANRFLGGSLDDFDKYYSKKKFEDVPGVKKLFEGIKYFNGRLPGNKMVCYYLGAWGALDYFSVFRGTENFFIDLYDNPKRVHEIFSFMTERSLDWLDFAEKTWGGCYEHTNIFDKIDIGEDYCAYMTPILFDEFVKPYTGKIFEKYKGKVLCSLHTDGDILSSGIHKLGEIGVDELMGFSPNIDIKEFRKALPDIILAGNIHPIEVMIEGNPEDVKAAVKYCFENANQNQKFVLCTGGAISAGAKPENVDAFLEAAYEIVKY